MFELIAVNQMKCARETDKTKKSDDEQWNERDRRRFNEIGKENVRESEKSQT